MRAAGLGAALGLLIACGLGPAATASAEPAAAEAQGSGPAEVRSPRGDPREWWTRAREVLFLDLPLSAEQAHGVDAIIETQLAARGREEALKAQLRAARRQGDEERSARIRAEIEQRGAARRHPHDVIEEIRKLLSEEQLPTFDMNRARLVAEGQEAAKARRGKRRGRRGAAVEAE